MAISVIMPALEVAQETGKLVNWLKKEGDSVRKGELLLEIETDKAVMEVEAEADGILAGVCANAGDEVPVGDVIAWIVNPGESLPGANEAHADAIEAAADPPRIKDATKGKRSEPNAIEQAAARKGRISPKARRLAKEAGIDIDSVGGTGPGGDILASAIQTLIDANTAGAPVAQVQIEVPQLERLSSIGRLMAERTAQSWTTVPHFFVKREIDAGALNAARVTLAPVIKLSHGIKLTHTDLLVALTARTLARHPRLNASWTSEGIRLNSAVNLSIAMAVVEGVVAAVVANAHTAPLGEIARQRRDLTERARTGRLRPADLADGTFTISNLGMFHVDSFTAIITPPQAAIMAVGAIQDRVVPSEGGVGVRPMLHLTLSVDHRVADGAKAAAFLQDLASVLQEPEKNLA